MKKIILKYSFLFAVVLIGSTIVAKAARPVRNIDRLKTDTVKNNVNGFNTGMQKSELDKMQKQKQREQLLDKLSKMPADFPEVFSNAKDEYLWKEKVKADQEEFERHVREMNPQNHQR
ncbi:MAG: hypothetical protein JST32_14000 [Bacteroidetes bacterium]|nr:hypothetical protein [Bacteroidota bacterium]